MPWTTNPFCLFMFAMIDWLHRSCHHLSKRSNIESEELSGFQFCGASSGIGDPQRPIILIFHDVQVGVRKLRLAVNPECQTKEHSFNCWNLVGHHFSKGKQNQSTNKPLLDMWWKGRSTRTELIHGLLLQIHPGAKVGDINSTGIVRAGQCSCRLGWNNARTWWFWGSWFLRYPLQCLFDWLVVPDSILPLGQSSSLTGNVLVLHHVRNPWVRQASNIQTKAWFPSAHRTV